MTDVPPAQRSERPSELDAMAAAVVDGRGIVSRWSRAAAAVSGLAAQEVCGRPAASVFMETAGTLSGGGVPAPGRAVLRHRSGNGVEVTLRAMALGGADGPETLLMAVSERRVTHVREGDRAATLVRALLGRDRVEAVLLDRDLRVVRTSDGVVSHGTPVAVGGGLCDLMSPPDSEVSRTVLRNVLDTGVRSVGWEERVRAPHVALCMDDATGRAAGVLVLYMDPMGKRRRRRHWEARYQAAIRIGRSLDVVRTAEDLVDVLMPSMADLVSVSLAEAVLRGDEPPPISGGGDQHQRRVAAGAASGPWPRELLQVGERMLPMPDTAETREVQRGGTIMVADRETSVAWLGTPELVRAYVPDGGHSVAFGSLRARDLVLGSVLLWRTEQPDTFTDEDVELLREIVSRAAIAVDNARRYRREHRAATALQQRLLPQAARETPGAETVGGYVPAGDGIEIGGDWFDVIPLPSLRVALVVGDVIGHGLHATATMGRLRTAVQTLADLELDPGEMLTHVDDLVQRLAAEAAPSHRDSVGGTLLYAVYDPVTRECAMAAAGHPAPVLIRPDGAAELVPLDPGPMLGFGGMPFEVTETRLEPGTVLALYTNGLTALHGPDTETGTRRLMKRLVAACRPDAALSGVSRDLLAGAADPPPRDDVTLLLARVRELGADATAGWEFAGDPASLADVRKAVTDQVAAWGLEELSFSTELIVSELVTNAIRYARGPYQVRLIRDNVLVCEVSDRSNTQPRLRRARVSDEGGRGLFLVAQLATRWGSRYGHAGKTVWAEQNLVP
ncbi:ATP-binding SpoIIE family protein phosphatase [Streptomyces sp. URMC 129]|uniref:ATP-binding SpoIIE family protein phosphatase n=1 Tax=Streptomyces sp. URMC 129 TaxID=3423407 RepID=UPI003F1BC632